MTYILPPSLDAYIEQHSSKPDEHLQQLDRETHLKVLQPRMLSGAVQGKFLEFISTMIRPKRILEIGTYTGYSGICMAKGLVEGGTITTIDINEELSSMVRRYVDAAGLTEKFDIRTGDATRIIPELSGPFELVFIDADKRNYSRYYELVIDKVPAGGWILADNVLWSGKVVEEATDKDTTAIRAFNELVQADERVENVLLSVRDGIMIVRKNG